nr:CoB--CoM heterodisulfide reductase iron-sulfur subunit B family protein [Desulfobacterales bacterium]
AVLSAFDVRLDNTELNCCGYPVRHQNLAASVLAAARNLAIADRKDLPLLTPCQCCFGNLKQAAYWLDENTELRRFVNGQLDAEGLRWHRHIPVRHLLSVLAEDIGIEKIRARVTHPLEGLSVAAHYGCHALRPGHVVQLDNPLAPTIFENLLAAIGATPLDWPLRLDCCGHPLGDKNPSLSLKLMARKLEDARGVGARVLSTACTHCQMQFDARPSALPEKDEAPLPALLYPQLLGLALGLPHETLGLTGHMVDGLAESHNLNS